MNRLTDQLDALLAVSVPFAVGPPAPGVTGDVEAFDQGNREKGTVVHMHMALLAGINWQEIGRYRSTLWHRT